MPKSANRRQIEIPTQLYAELQADAKARGTTVTQVLVDLVQDGRTLHEWLTGIDAKVTMLTRDIAGLRTALEKLERDVATRG